MSARRMRAAVIAEPRHTRVESVPLPEVGPGQVRIQLEGCGVCGSNGPSWEGRTWFRYPMQPGAPGHEGWGHVEALGPGVIGLAVGERVAFLSSHAFAEYDVTDASKVVRLPRALEGKPFPGEALACAMNIFSRSDIHPGHTVAIIGIGFLGALLTRLAVYAGARVLAITRRASALEVARHYGADELLPMVDHDGVIHQVKELTGGRFCERVIEAVGLQWPLDLATELTGVRGRLVIAGYHQDGLRQVNLQKWNWRGLDVVNAHERDESVYVQGLRQAVDAVASGWLDPSPLYTHSFPLAQMDEAFQCLHERPEGFMKAWVRP